jgi:hypothetical protein
MNMFDQQYAEFLEEMEELEAEQELNELLEEVIKNR